MTTRTLTRDMTLNQLILDTLARQTAPVTSRKLFGKIRQRRASVLPHAFRARLSELNSSGRVAAVTQESGDFVYSVPTQS